MKTVRHLFFILLAVVACNDDNNNPTPVTNGQDSTVNLASAIVGLEGYDDLDTLISAIGDSRFALLGEATHGTSEFYEWRAEISKQLIQQKGFNIILVEGDWPALYKFNQYIHGDNTYASAAEVLSTLNRWPTWMWANEEVAAFGEWLRGYNQQHSDEQVSFYGMTHKKVLMPPTG
jgi:erythromycin esterase